jgi:hypothetical protein
VTKKNIALMFLSGHHLSVQNPDPIVSNVITNDLINAVLNSFSKTLLSGRGNHMKIIPRTARKTGMIFISKNFVGIA